LQTEGGVQTAGLLRVDLLPLWLTGLSTKAIRPEMKPRLDRYQDEAAKVLWEAFQSGRLTADPSFDELLNDDSPAAQAYKMAQAMMELARNQLLLESRLDSHGELLNDHGQRLEQVEATLGDPGRHVTPDQAMQISQAVKMIAMELSKRNKTNEYGAVYGQLYRQFAVTSYKQLPANQFDKAMNWLTDWYKRITGATGPDEVPF
jgi:ferritin-like metal-binding protein YciE